MRRRTARRGRPARPSSASRAAVGRRSVPSGRSPRSWSSVSCSATSSSARPAASAEIARVPSATPNPVPTPIPVPQRGRRLGEHGHRRLDRRPPGAGHDVCPADAPSGCASIDKNASNVVTLSVKPKSVHQSPTSGQMIVFGQGVGVDRPDDVRHQHRPERAADVRRRAPSPPSTPSTHPVERAVVALADDGRVEPVGRPRLRLADAVHARRRAPRRRRLPDTRDEPEPDAEGVRDGVDRAGRHACAVRSDPHRGRLRGGRAQRRDRGVLAGRCLVRLHRRPAALTSRIRHLPLACRCAGDHAATRAVSRAGRRGRVSAGVGVGPAGGHRQPAPSAQPGDRLERIGSATGRPSRPRAPTARLPRRLRLRRADADEFATSSFLVDPATLDRTAIPTPAWRPAVDPTGRFVVYWEGTVALDPLNGGWLVGHRPARHRAPGRP